MNFKNLFFLSFFAKCINIFGIDKIKNNFEFLKMKECDLIELTQ
jgi:hypothetical protein